MEHFLLVSHIDSHFVWEPQSRLWLILYLYELGQTTLCCLPLGTLWLPKSGYLECSTFKASTLPNLSLFVNLPFDVILITEENILRKSPSQAQSGCWNVSWRSLVRAFVTVYHHSVYLCLKWKNYSAGIIANTGFFEVVFVFHLLDYFFLNKL